MPNPVMLNNVHHKDLRVVTRRAAAYGDDVMFATTFPAEFRTLQGYYPIVFRKTDDAVSFEPVALFGLREGENLFLNEAGWDAPEVPLMIERQPFLIGRNGMHRYNNQDHSMLTAKKAVELICSGDVRKNEIWDVNVDDEYHEEKK